MGRGRRRGEVGTLRRLRTEVRRTRAKLVETILSLNIRIKARMGAAEMRRVIGGRRPVDSLSLSVLRLNGKGLSVDAVERTA